MFRSALLLCSGLLLISGCAKKQDGPAAGGDKKFLPVGEVTSVTARGDRAPNFSWKDSTGKSVDFDAYRGKVTLVNFWATWCVPCKRELPDLVALSRDLSGKNVRILGIATDRGDAVAEVATFVQEHGIPYQNIVSNEELEEAFGNVGAIPTSFLIGPDGKIAQRYVGPRTREFFAQAIEALAK